MKVKYGLISADSHAQLDKNAFKKYMPASKFSDRIPHVVEVRQDHQEPVERWSVDGRVVGHTVVNCPAVMNRKGIKYYPEHWDEVPAKVYDPLERLKALDEDRVDGEVLFPNTPIQNFNFSQSDTDFELACVQAYNNALAEWRQASDRYVPLALIPYRNGVETTVAEVERAVKIGHGGLTILSEPSSLVKGLPHFSDPYWYPVWEVCQSLDIPIHLHESGGLASTVTFPRWEGFSRNQFHSLLTVPTGAFPCIIITNLVFSGILERFPRLKWVSAETGLGWVNYVIEGCDYEWERRKLWQEGLKTRPSELFRRQVYVNFWFEKTGIKQRRQLNPDHIMWESDYPHTASTYPNSWNVIEETLKEVTAEERRKILFENAVRLYHLQ